MCDRESRSSSYASIAACLWAIASLLILPIFTAHADDSAAERLSRYLQIDTTNPPGNEIAGAQFIAGILDEAGITYEIAESASGRANLWARLRAADPATAKPGMIVLHHIDVVSASPRHWDLDPLSGTIRDGYIYGRGALDTKGLGIMQLQAFLALAKSGAPLNRDVVYMATSDEEAGGYMGAGWLVKNRPEIFKGMGFLVNEGSFGLKFPDTSSVMLVEVTQKVPLWMRLTASGRPGHGSMPPAETAVTRIISAAYRIMNTEFPVRVLKPVNTMFLGMAPYQPTEQAKQDFANLPGAVERSDFLRQLQMEQPSIYALLSNTCSLTRLAASDKVNVIPPEASLEMDCRLLPDQSPDEFMDQLTAIIDDPSIKLETLVNFAPAISPTDNELFRAIEAVTEQFYPGTPVVPSVAAGFTDSHFFRELGIASYGYLPALLPPEEVRGIHGNNERISIENMQRGSDSLYALLKMMTID